MSRANNCCARHCGNRIPENEAMVLITTPLKAYRGLLFRWQTGCLKCYSQTVKSGDWTLRPCHHCGRPLYIEIEKLAVVPWDNGVQLVACNAECRALAQAKQWRHLPPQICPVCRLTFTPKRTDSRFCSNACRKRAYRRRIKTRTP